MDIVLFPLQRVLLRIQCTVWPALGFLTHFALEIRRSLLPWFGSAG